MLGKLCIFFLVLIYTGSAATGLTWVLNPGNASSNWIGAVGCRTTCDPYVGDTDCEEYLPILCINLHNVLAQPSSFTCPNPSRPCWAGAVFTTTIPFKGDDLTSKAVGDFECRRQYGESSKMAEHHDAWGWVSNGYILSTWTGRAWTWINNQPNGNCH